MSKEPRRRANAIYRDPDARTCEPIPAATVVLLHDTDHGAQVLMLRKKRNISFGGMWVFPGGRIDAEDFSGSGDLEIAARNAAVRETHEEAELRIDSQSLIWFSHWTPPVGSPRRYATWFFAADANHLDEVRVDGREIEDHTWIKPASALDLHQSEEIDLLPPTWVTLYTVSKYQSTAEILGALQKQGPRIYKTRHGERTGSIRVAMWEGDAGYESGCVEAEGPRHRLTRGSHWHSFEYPEGMY